MALNFQAGSYYLPWRDGRRAEEENLPNAEAVTTPLLEALSLLENRKRGRNADANNISMTLARESNYTPEQIKAISDSFIRTGTLEFPGQAGYGPVYEPVQFGRRGIQPQAPETRNEVKRKTKDGRIAVFDEKTKEFLRYE